MFYQLRQTCLKKKKDITVKTYHEVIAINDKDQTVTVVNRQTNEKFEASYDKLILSPGAGANSLDLIVITYSLYAIWRILMPSINL